MIKLANLKDLREGKGLIVAGPDGKEIALFLIGEKVFAIHNVCPHMGGPLGEGDLSVEEGRCVVTCPWHGWEFEVCSGDCINTPGENAEKIEVVVKDGDIYLVDSV